MPTRRRKRLTGIGVVVGAMSPIRPNVIWALDFQFDITADGRTLKMLDVIDEFTRECPAIEVDRIIDADHVVAVLDRLALARGAPTYVRFDIHSESRVDRPTAKRSRRHHLILVMRKRKEMCLRSSAG